ncbi:MAG TPA: STAS domain-containing protein [Bryobacteraceae bacterium]|nr:STAS domain-containing protein [Bryobacteraceae bacterium]
MPYSITAGPGGQLLKLEGAVTIRQARELAAALREGLEDAAPLEVDTGALEDIDTCILQLLCSLRKTAPALCFENPSEAFLAAVERCGLRRELLGAREGQ